MAVIHSDVKAQLRCNENNFTTDWRWRDTVTSSLRDKGRGLEACRKYLIAIAEIIFNVTSYSEPSNLLLIPKRSCKKNEGR